eukprot:64912_1
MAKSLIIFIVLLLGQTQSINQDCNDAFECVGTEWILSDAQSIYGYGYKSLYGASTSITTNYQSNIVYCKGAFACAQISFITNTQDSLSCEGSYSCANIDGLSHINGERIECSGSNSCQNSNIISNENINENIYVSCGGSQSCIYTNITTPIVSVSGAYSLYASIIDSQFVINNELNVYLYGYQSGFGGTILCRAGDICNIYCYNNGCEMLYLECEQNSDCNILLNNNDAHITIPPIRNLNEYDYTLYNIKYNSKTYELCENVSNFVYDNYREQKGIIETNEQNSGPVCCRGSHSCFDTVSIAFTDTVSDIVVCSGTRSCQDTIINTTISVFCEGYWSCLSTVINKANNVYCLGVFACQHTVIHESKNVYCLGAYACSRSTIKSNG